VEEGVAEVEQAREDALLFLRLPSREMTALEALLILNNSDSSAKVLLMTGNSLNISKVEKFNIE
jgi:hypothetical protein